MFDPVDPRQSFPDLERGILKYWHEEDVFQRSVKERGSGESFHFYDGPPFATGLPHYGHLLAGTIKDVIPRYQTMRSKRVERRFGWDCHGLPVENIIEKEHGVKSHADIQKMGVKAFNQLCRTAVQRYTKEWREVVERMGRFVDMDNDYRTMDPDYMESIWWVFSELHRKGLVYEGKKAMHVCPRCVTPLSNFEVTQGYKDVSDVAVTWKFALAESGQKGKRATKAKKEKRSPGKTYLLAWTTTPWSTLSTMGLSVLSKATYVKVQVGEECIICVKDRMPDVMKGVEKYEVIDEFKGKDLVGLKYEHIAPWYRDIPEVRENKNVHRVFAGDYVEVTEGTGIVTINGSYGEIDMEAAKKNKLPIVMDVAMDGHFTLLAGPYEGLYVKDAEKKIIEDCAAQGLVWRKESYTHSYPHCWRCETPLLNYATSSWFVNVEKIKERLLTANAKTEWVPANIRDGRFGKWLEGARDWAVSRNRFWGTPLPIWRSEGQGSEGQGRERGQRRQRGTREGAMAEIEVISSRDELMMKCPIRFTKVTVLRHGESEGNLIPVYQGKLPGSNLSAAGEAQAKATGEKLTNENVSAIYASPLARTQQTAALIAKATDIPVQTDDRLREVDFGEYEGKTVDFSDMALVKARRAHKLETGAPESIFHFPGMESWKDVQTRISAFLQEVLPKHRGEHIVIVTHADPVQNVHHFFTREDPVKISHRPYPKYADPVTFYFDHETGRELDLHKDTVDGITWKNRNGETMRRVPEVFDCWFESGSMPYAQSHYPFTQQSQSPCVRTNNLKPPGFPADFIAEGIDQTRGWFYTLMVLSVALFDQPAFRHCIVNGIVLAEDGKKMSKRLKNYPEPMELVEKFGADAVRFALMSSPAVRGEDLRFSAALVEETVRSVLLPLWNVYSFFVTYANAAKFSPVEDRRHSSHPLDLHIRAEMQDLANRMTRELDAFDLSATCGELHDSIDALTNWYVRLSRRRFAGKASIETPDASYDSPIENTDEDRLDALHTLYDVLLTMSQLLAPFCPFICDALYLNLVAEEHGSVHLTDWPEIRTLSKTEESLLKKVRLSRLIVSLGNQIRNSAKIKNRQPLAKATIAIPSALAVELSDEDHMLLRQEMNVKEIAFTADPGSLAHAVVRVDARKVGPRLGARVQEVIQAGKRGDFTQEENGTILILDERLSPTEASIVYQSEEGEGVAADHGIVVAIDTRMTEELKAEGLIRDLIRAVQRIRKESGFAFTDIVALSVEGADDLLQTFSKLLAEETRSTIERNDGLPQEIDLEGKRVIVRIKKRGS
ncbi:MAG: class I tRNA ligase family protein [Candidatus Peregrinibacteria bacterium]